MTENRFLQHAYTTKWDDLAQVKREDSSFNAENHLHENGYLEARHLDADLKGFAEAAFITNTGYLFVNGWLLDPYRRPAWHESPNVHFSINMSYYSIPVPVEKLIRYSRNDVNDSFKVQGYFDFGFMLMIKIDESIPISNVITLHVENSARTDSFEIRIDAQLCSEVKLLSRYFSALRHLHESHFGVANCLQTYDQHGEALIACWQSHLAYATYHDVVEMGEKLKKPKFTFITVLYGGTDMLKPQLHLLFSHVAKLGGQVILVSNTRDIHRRVLDLCTYYLKMAPLDLTVVLMNDNAGFSEANNIGARYARSDNIALVNPDIFPYHGTSWANFLSIVENLTADQVIAPLLHYSDGSVMHSGMSVHVDPIFLPLSRDRLQGKKQYDYILRVDHPYKGHLLNSFRFEKKLEEVDAVTGGFLIVKKKLFEKIGGLSNTYIFGHYEDADLCLRAKKAGAKVFVATDLSFVHLEGKGSKSPDQLASSGGTIFNRCHFTRNHETAYQGKSYA